MHFIAVRSILFTFIRQVAAQKIRHLKLQVVDNLFKLHDHCYHIRLKVKTIFSLKSRYKGDVQNIIYSKRIALPLLEVVLGLNQ